MRLFIYLNETEHADTWLEGGQIPILPASHYRKKERKGIHTPDELLIYNSPIPIESLENYGISIRGAVKDCSFIDCKSNGFRIPDIHNLSHYEEDALVLCFCKSSREELAERFGGKQACVEIQSIKNLKRYIDRQLGYRGELRECKYTNDHQRNHFLKSEQDAWQEEVRIIWKVHNPAKRWVKVKPGTAKLVWSK